MINLDSFHFSPLIFSTCFCNFIRKQKERNVCFCSRAREPQVNEETLHVCWVNTSNASAITFLQCETFKLTGCSLIFGVESLSNLTASKQRLQLWKHEIQKSLVCFRFMKENSTFIDTVLIIHVSHLDEAVGRQQFFLSVILTGRVQKKSRHERFFYPSIYRLRMMKYSAEF